MRVLLAILGATLIVGGMWVVGLLLAALMHLIGAEYVAVGCITLFWIASITVLILGDDV